jgi:flagellar basal-body rod protein FlgC
VFRTWLDAVSDNISNLSTARRTSEDAFQARYIEANPVEGGGVEVAGVVLGNPTGRLVSDLEHPLADENGMIRMPDIDLADQMTQLIAAQRGYQANLAVIERARDAYAQALTIGRS